jgi:hypothetical protein
MAKEPSLSDVFNRNQYDLKTAVRKSTSWFQQQALIIKKQNITPKNVLKGQNMTGNIKPGNLYMFLYEAKNKETLPYWDMFPLVFPYEKTKDGFLGLNMHYLPYQLRVQLLDRLMQFANNNSLNETTRLKYSWSLIGGVTKFKAAEPCIKHYLNNHVRSSFKQIPAQDWATAMMLPVESFVGANKNKVWQDSKRLIAS